MFYLNEKDILSTISLNSVMDAIEEAYKIFEKGDFFMPDRMHVDYGAKNLLYMPCFKANLFGTKILTVFPENAGKHPVIDGLMLLNDLETGEPKGLLDGKVLTAVRTGAVGGVGVRHTTPEDLSTVGLIGAGVQGFYQLRYACAARPIKKIYIYDAYKKDLSDFINRLEKVIDKSIEINVCENTEELAKKSELIITCTNATSPILPDNEELLRGKHFIGIGSYKPEMREFPDALSKLVDEVIIDTEFALEESGDLITPINNGLLKESQMTTFAEFLKGKKDISKTTLFKSVGMALFDVIVAEYVYNEALKQEKGQKIEL
jgi:ornithine cyclodeaminase